MKLCISFLFLSVAGLAVAQPLPDYTFKMVMTDNKNPIRQICSLLFTELRDVQRIRIMNVRIGYLASNSYRELEGDELDMFLSGLGL